MADLVLPHSIDSGTEIVAAEHQANYVAIRDKINGNIQADNIADGAVEADTLDSSGVADVLGLSQTGSVRRGKSIIATEETVTSTSYTTLTTPDRVSNVVLPTDGLIFVVFQAMWKNSVSLNGRAALFLGSNQVKLATGTATTPDTTGTEAVGPGSTGVYNTLVTYGGGLWCETDTQAYPGDATTGQLIGSNDDGGGSLYQGGAAVLFAAAGTYNVSVQFKSASGTVTAKDRKLWVWTVGF